MTHRLKGLGLVLAALGLASCSSGPSAPSAATVSSVARAEGSASTAAVTTERIQLRTSAGRLISAGLVNGQTVDVPLGEDLDIWAEIRRLETDRARLVVDWGNGNADFTGCGSCRLTNKYTSEGRYSVIARIVDLNAPTDSATITSVKVILNVLDYPRLERFACATVTENFESFPNIHPLPYTPPGLKIEASGGGNTVTVTAAYPTIGPELINRAVGSEEDLSFTFDSDKNAFEIGLAVVAGRTLTFTAFDSQGAVVASGPLDVSIPSPGFLNTIKGFMRIAAPPFRRVLIQVNGPSPRVVFADNLVASCK